MPDAPDRSLSLETVRRLARERARLELSDAQLQALVPMLRDLQAEIDRIRPEDRAGSEPEVTFNLEGWAP